MTKSDVGAISPAERRMRDILARPEMGPQARLAELREAGLVPPADGDEVRTLELADVEVFTTHDPRHSPGIPSEILHPPLVHLDPDTPFKTDGATGRSWLIASDAVVTTGGYPESPSRFKLPSHEQYSPPSSLLITFSGLAAGQKFTAKVDMEVYQGRVRIQATNGQSKSVDNHARGKVRIDLTTTASGSIVEGWGVVNVQNEGDSGFYWYGVDLRPS